MTDDTLKAAREAFQLCIEAEADNRAEAMDDIRFARLGEQWPAEVAARRRRDGRPTLTINRLPAFIRQVVNDARQNISTPPSAGCAATPPRRLNPVRFRERLERSASADRERTNLMRLPSLSRLKAAADMARDWAALLYTPVLTAYAVWVTALIVWAGPWARATEPQRLAILGWALIGALVLIGLGTLFYQRRPPPRIRAKGAAIEVEVSGAGDPPAAPD